MIRAVRVAWKPLTAEDQRIITALVDCTGEVLSDSDFVWHVEDGVVSISGTGKMAGSGAIIVLPGSWRIYLPRRLKLKLMVRAYTKDLQRLATKAAKAPWPAKNARCHVRVGRDNVTVSWSASWRRRKLIELQPCT